MKTLLIIVLAFLMIGCSEDTTTSNCGVLLEGEHLLRRFKVKTTSEERWSGSYFLIGGGASGGTYTKTDVSFSFKLSDGTYAMASLPLQKIRVKIDNNIKVPYVKFRWEWSESTSIESIMYHHVVYMVVHCQEEDFPMDVQINDL